jgi:hypothetical protein
VLLVNCNEIQNKAQRDKEVFALTRDGFYRENPDELLGGFFAAWPVVLYIIGGFLFYFFLKLFKFFSNFKKKN